MAVPSPKTAEAEAFVRHAGAGVRLARDEDQGTPSPALQLHDALYDQLIRSERADGEPAKWSQRRTLAFIALTCGGFWVCAFLGLARLAH